MELTKSKVTKRKLVRDDKPEKNKDKPNRKKRHLEEAMDPCIVCEEFGKDNEWWVTCLCGKSSHAECAGVEITQVYICHFCQP